MGEGAAAAGTIRAFRASGVVVRLGPGEFSKIMERADDPLIVFAQGGFVLKNYHYLMSYKGLVFYTKSGAPLPVPSGAELVEAGRIWVPRAF